MISLLAALLLPALKQARERGRTVYCMANVRQLNLGFHLYANEYLGALPWSWNSGADQDAFNDTGGGSQGGYGGFTWALCVYPFIQNIRVYTCPSFPYNFKPIYAVKASTGHDYIYGAHYRANPYLGLYGYGFGTSATRPPTGQVVGRPPPNPPWYEFYPAKLDSVRRASDKISVYDAAHYHYPYGTTPDRARDFFANYLGDWDRTNPDNYSPWYWRPNIGNWHNRRTNVGFFDGHCELVPDTSPKTWANYNQTFDDDDVTSWSLYD